MAVHGDYAIQLLSLVSPNQALTNAINTPSMHVRAMSLVYKALRKVHPETPFRNHPMTEFPPDTRDNQHRSDVSRGVSGRAFEHHFTPKEIAKLWNKDEDTIRRIFRNEPGVLCLESMNRRKRTRRYVSLSIPESVVARVHQRLEVQEHKPKTSQTRTGNAMRAGQRIAAASTPSATGTPDAPQDSDEQWQRQAIRTARALKNRVQGTKG